MTAMILLGTVIAGYINSRQPQRAGCEQADAKVADCERSSAKQESGELPGKANSNRPQIGNAIWKSASSNNSKKGLHLEDDGDFIPTAYPPEERQQAGTSGGVMFTSYDNRHGGDEEHKWAFQPMAPGGSSHSAVPSRGEVKPGDNDSGHSVKPNPGPENNSPPYPGFLPGEKNFVPLPVAWRDDGPAPRDNSAPGQPKKNDKPLPDSSTDKPSKPDDPDHKSPTGQNKEDKLSPVAAPTADT